MGMTPPRGNPVPTPPQFECELLGSGGHFECTAGMTFTKSMSKSRRRRNSKRPDPSFVVQIEYVVSAGGQRRIGQGYEFILRVAGRVKGPVT